MNDELKMIEEKIRKKLSMEQFHVMREKGTEPPFSGKYLNNKKKGVYSCAACGNNLFLSDAKFDSGSGWPSFDMPISEDSVDIKEDKRHGMRRIEVICLKCDSHLGHVFNDGPTMTNKRYCINSCALNFNE